MLTSELETRLRDCLTAIYGADQQEALFERLRSMLAVFAANHPAPPATPPHDRLTQDTTVLITYGDQVHEPDHSPLQSLEAVLQGSLAGAVSGVHILPFYPYTSDDGFSVVDYTVVDPHLGDWVDIASLGQHYRLMFDAVVNHISASSAWFQAFLRGEPGAERRFLVLDPATDLRGITRPRTTPVLTPFETPSGVQYVWTTFSADQIDLNFANPDLLLEMTAILLEYVAHGATLIRLDAIGYLWKEIGTRCIHLPQTHRVVQLWRAALDAVAPDVLLITETNVPHADNISYFGDGSNEAQMVYQFPLAPLTLNAFASGTTRHLTGWASQLEPPGTTTTFFNFLASHDGIGVVPATGILSGEEVAALCRQIERHGGRVSYKNNPDGSQSAYELNCTLFDALSDPYDTSEPLAKKIDRFIAAHAIMFALQGVPGIYIHSLLGSPNWHAGLAETGRARTINREKWQRTTLEALLNTPEGRAQQVFTRLRSLLQLRRAEPAFHPNSAQQVLDLGSGVFALRRTPASGPAVVCIQSVAAQAQTIELGTEARGGSSELTDLLTGRVYPPGTGSLTLELAAYQVAWLRGAAH